MNLLRLLLVSVLLAAAPGCLSPAQRLESAAVQSIIEGQTTRSEIESRFGKPRELTVGSNGKTVANYWSVMESPPSPTLTPMVYVRSLSVLYNDADVAERFLHNESTRPIERGITGVSVGAPLPDSSRIERGKTTASEAVTLFGPPDAKWLTPEGRTVMEWAFIRRDRGNELETSAKRFLLLVDGNGVVSDFNSQGRMVPRMSP